MEKRTLVVICLSLATVYGSVELPDPHLVIISSNGVESGSLANVILGSSPDCTDCLIDVCSEMVTTPPCSSDIKYAVGEWVGSSQKCSLIHAADFGKSGNDEHERIKDFIQVLKTFTLTNNRFLIVLDGKRDDFDTNFDNVLRELGALFGKEFWRRLVLGATNWHFDEESIQNRNMSGKGEEWWRKMMGESIMERFDVTIDIPAVFIDADAKLVENLDDTLQSEAFDRESKKLLQLLESTLSMEMKTLQEQTDYLNNVINFTINDTIAEMQAKITKLMDDMVEVQDDIIDNGIEIHDVSGIVAVHQIDITEHGQIITEHGQIITEYGQTITEHDQMITANGKVITEHGQIIDANGKDITKNGQSISANGIDITEHGNAITEHGNAISENIQVIAEHGNIITEHDQVITENGQDIDNIFSWFNDVTPPNVQCSGYTRLFSDVTITSQNYPSYYPIMRIAASL